MSIFEADPLDEQEHWEGLQYRESWAYVWRQPGGAGQIFWLGLAIFVAGLVPVLGQMVVSGYQAELLERLVRSRGRFAPRFDPGAIGRYFSRGTVPGAILFLWMVMLLFAGYMGFYLSAVIAFLSLGPTFRPEFFYLLLALFAVAMVLFVSVSQILLTPMLIRGGLMSSLTEALRIEWGIDFLRRAGRHVLLGIVALFFVYTGVALVSLVTLGLGAPFAMAGALLMQTHLWFQLYLIYLSEEGTPIPFDGDAEPLDPAPEARSPDEPSGIWLR